MGCKDTTFLETGWGLGKKIFGKKKCHWHCGWQLSNAIDKNRKKLPTALCKKRGKLSGGGGENNKVALKSVSAACNSFLFPLAV